MKVSPTSDQFYLFMFDNLYVKHNLSDLGDENSLKYLLTGRLDSTSKIPYFVYL